MEPSKENKAACLKIFGDCKSLEYYNTLDSSDLRIMSDALVKSCRDLEHARRVVDTWIEGNREYPKAADLHRLARETWESSQTVTLPSPCDLCRDIPGYRLVEVVTKSGPFAGETNSALALCRCERGKALGEAAVKLKKEKYGPWRAPEKEEFTQIRELLK